MKRKLFALLLFAGMAFAAMAAPATGALNNTSGRDALRSELTRQIPDCAVVAENAARLIARGSNEAEVLSEWRGICPNSEFIAQYELSQRVATIEKTSPEISWSLWLTIRSNKNRRLPANGEYYTLLSTRAAAANPHSVDGKLLKAYFTGGRYAFDAELRRTSGGRFHEFAATQEKLKSGLSMTFAANAGAWLPQGNLARVGSHPSLGFMFNIGVDRIYLGMAMDFRFLDTPTEYRYYDINTKTLTPTNNFFGLYMAFDLRWDFWQIGNTSVMLAGGIGYDLISHRTVSRYSGLRPAYSDSFNLNGGLAIRQYFSASRGGYIELDLRAHKVQFSDGGLGGDDLSGYYFTALVSVGYRLAFDD